MSGVCFKCDYGKPGFRTGVPGGISLKKNTRCQAELIFQAQDIVGGEKLVQITTAFIETGDLLGA